MKPRRLLVSVTLLSATAALLVMSIRRVDFRLVMKYLDAGGAHLVMVIALFQAVLLVLYAAEWRAVLLGAGVAMPLGRVFLARLGGASVSYISPPVSVGGEVVRTGLMKGHATGIAALSATVAVDKVLEIGTRLPAVAIGLLLLSATTGGATAVGLIAALLGTGLPVVAAIGVFLALKSPRPLRAGSIGARGLRSLASRIAPSLVSRVAGGMSEFRRNLRTVLAHRNVLLRAAVFGFLASMIDVLQTYVVLHLLCSLNLAAAFVMFSSMIVQSTVGVLPGNAGGVEATSMFVATILGMDPAMGLVYALLLRSGQAFWVVGGLTYFLYRLVGRQRSRR